MTKTQILLIRGLGALAFAALATWAPCASAQLVVTGGTAKYSHAIEVPPGAGGLAPKLRIDYVGAGDGAVGLGWSLEGSSLVTRCPHLQALDNARRAVALDENDKLCLDGDRLIPLDANGTAVVGRNTGDATGMGANAYKEYRTEKDSYARIRSYGIADGSDPRTGPAYFKAWTKDGRIIELGEGPSTASDPNTRALNRAHNPQTGRVHAQTWAVSRIIDTFGNFIDFKYVQRDLASGSQAVLTLGREVNLAEIQYSGNKIVFHYSDRTSGVLGSRSEAYNGFTKFISVQQLDAITTYVNSRNTMALGPSASAVAAKTTKLSYDTGPTSGRLRLVSIKTCAGDRTSTTCLPPATFGYSSGGGDAYEPSSAFNLAGTTLYTTPAGPLCCAQPFSSIGTATVDLNGDGRTDIMRWSNTPADNRLYVSNGDGSFSLSPSFNVTGDVLVDGYGCRQVVFKDFNGDGLADIFRFAATRGSYIDSQNNCPDNGPSLVFLNSGNGTFARHVISGVTLQYQWGQDVQQPLPQGGFVALNGPGHHFTFLDADGDGLLDVVTTFRPPYYYSMYEAGTPRDDCSVTVCTRVYKGNGNGSFGEITQTNLAHARLYPVPTLAPVGGTTIDFNGDGLEDLPAGTTTGVGSIAVSLGNGDFALTPSAYLKAGVRFSLDYNGDGRPDVLAADPGHNVPALFVHDSPSNMDSLVSNRNVTGTLYVSVGPYSYINGFTADFNGDGRDDIYIGGTVRLSNGDGTFNASSTFVRPTGLGHTWDSNQKLTSTFLVGDFTGSGFPEFLQIGSTNTLFVRSSREKPDLLTSATSSGGATSSLSYFPLSNPNLAGTSLGPRYTTDRQTAFAASRPSVDVVGPMYVVGTLTTDSGVGVPTTTEYAYYGLKADATGRGSLGFRKVLEQSFAPDGSVVTLEVERSQAFPYTGMSTRARRYRGSLAESATATTLSETRTIYCDQTAAAGADATAIASGLHCPSASKVRRPYTLWQRQTATDLSGHALPTNTVQRAVNADGEPTQVSTTAMLTGAGSDTYTEVVTSLYHQNDTSCSDYRTCKWILSRPSTVATQRSAPNAILPTSAGTSPYASETAGSVSAPRPPMSPAVLSAILQLLLDD